MQRKTLTTSTGDVIDIYDNVFDKEELNRYHYFAGNSLFHTKGTSLGTYESRKDFFLRSNFSQEDVFNFALFRSPNYSKMVDTFDIKFNPIEYWIILSTHLSEYTYHPDALYKGRKSMLFYINPHWNQDWGGETMFCNRKGEVELATEFKPGRIVIFDNNILHKPAPLSVSSIPYRFTFVAMETHQKNL